MKRLMKLVIFLAAMLVPGNFELPTMIEANLFNISVEQVSFKVSFEVNVVEQSDKK